MALKNIPANEAITIFALEPLPAQSRVSAVPGATLRAGLGVAADCPSLELFSASFADNISCWRGEPEPNISFPRSRACSRIDATRVQDEMFSIGDRNQIFGLRILVIAVDMVDVQPSLDWTEEDFVDPSMQQNLLVIDPVSGFAVDSFVPAVAIPFDISWHRSKLSPGVTSFNGKNPLSSIHIG